MPDTKEHTDILDRLKKAEVGSKWLNGLVCKRLGIMEEGARWEALTGQWIGTNVMGRDYTVRPEPATTSLDAVEALCERFFPGWVWHVKSGPSSKCAWLYPVGAQTAPKFEAATPAIALCIAMLCASKEKADA